MGARTKFKAFKVWFTDWPELVSWIGAATAGKAKADVVSRREDAGWTGGGFPRVRCRREPELDHAADPGTYRATQIGWANEESGDSYGLTVL